MPNIEFVVDIYRLSEFGVATATDLALPATWTEIRDALDKTRITGEKITCKTELLEAKREFLLSVIPENANLFELNHLAERLSELDEWQNDCFEGMSRMAAIDMEREVPMYWIIHMTHILKDCQIISTIRNDHELGEFCVKNGLIDDFSSLPENVRRLLDFDMIGRERRTAEYGVFTEKGYLFCNSWPKQNSDFIRYDIPLPQNPEYPVTLKLESGGPKYNNDYDGILHCPASEEDFDSALNASGAASYEDCKYTCIDCLIPSLKKAIDDANDIGCVNEFAEALVQLQQDDSVARYKALLEATGCDNLDSAIQLMNDADSYILHNEMTGPMDYAREYLSRLGSVINLSEVTDLYTCGVKVMQHDNAANTSYGILLRKDGGPIQKPEQETDLQIGM